MACDRNAARTRPRRSRHPNSRCLNLIWLKPFLIDGHRVLMTPIERDIFAAIFNKRGRLVTFDEMIDFIWGRTGSEPPLDMQSSISTNVYRLRLSLERTSFRIINDRGRGFHMERVAA